ncbi:MAG TPA: GTP-binding protein [Stellaceae bacterium]|nr:GTP-binding protein [Stellaceae bacterium]
MIGPGVQTLDSIPVTLLTGFLGSGKTTLLRRALAAPSFSDTAVIINEIGAISIDHYLVDFVEGSVLELPGGCLCCLVREDLAQSLRSLIERRDAGEIRRFRRIAIETSGLADPAPILFTLGADPMLDQRLRLSRVVTLVDAVEGAGTLDRFAEATRQAAVADALVISKTDLAPFGSDLVERLDALNPAAERILGADAADPAAVLFASQSPSPALRERVAEAQPRPGEGACNITAARPLTPTLCPAGGEGVLGGAAAHTHSHGIAAFAVAFGAAIGRLDFARALGGLAQDRGNDLLRVKGLVEFADRPGKPAVVQAAQHAMFTPEWLDAWPDADHRSRLVFIVHDIPPEAILDRFAFASPVLIGEPVSQH